MKTLFQIVKNNLSFGKYSPDACHERLLREKYPLYAYDKVGKDPDFKGLIEKAFFDALGDMPDDFEPICREESRVDKGDHIRIRMIIETEPNVECPCLLLLPKGRPNPPVVICLQGHSNGMMISVGEPYERRDLKKISEDRDFALQAIKHGYAAMVVEQRGFGERRSRLRECMCTFLAENALLVGRTLIGERIWDVKQVINVLEKRSDVDAKRIGIMGNSGGGTASYYAACVDKRIKVVMPGCAICTYKDSIGKEFHCPCNFLPGAGKYFDMGELACLIYPRPIVVVSGKRDPIFPIEGAENVVNVMKEIYGDKKDNIYHFVGNGKHRFYAGGWDKFDEYMNEIKE